MTSIPCEFVGDAKAGGSLEEGREGLRVGDGGGEEGEEGRDLV